MKGFKDSTRTISGHHAGLAGRAVGQVRSFAPSPAVRRFAEGGHAVPDVDPRGPRADEGHALVHRDIPTTTELDEAGGRSPLKSGYAKGGKSKAAKHFHVHKHYHEGGKIRSVSKSYKGKSAEREAERQVEGATKMMPKSKGGQVFKGDRHIHDATSIPPESPDYATGGTIDRMNAGGSAYGGHATGGTADPLAVGGMPQRGVMVGAPPQGSALGSLAARRPMPGRPMPVMRAAGGRASPTAGRSAAKAAVTAHERAPAPRGHKGLGAMLKRS
jgi:hypothetical protein